MKLSATSTDQPAAVQERQGEILPSALASLWPLALNLRWSWQPATRGLFYDIDPGHWAAAHHNPVRVLEMASASRLEALASDGAFLARMHAIANDLDLYLTTASSWFRANVPDASGGLVAYFSAEFGITECLPIFSGGLGVLAGDHLKSASDLGVPLVGVGLLYREGYFRQSIDDDGRQEARYDPSRFEDLPIVMERHADGSPLDVEVPFPGRPVHARVWRAQVGRVALLLLDTDVPENAPLDRLITGRLYGGDNETRIQQELILGVGGCRALDALGLTPTVYHMNEGHAAFLGLERIRARMAARGESFEAALTEVRQSTVFTTHTPVPAGHDYFPPELATQYLGPIAPGEHIGRDDLLALGRRYRDDPTEYFCMTVLALRLARSSNGVSKLHGAVSNNMWRALFLDAAATDAPIDHVTNGIHVATWVGPEQAAFYTEQLGADWLQRIDDPSSWARIYHVPDAAVWRQRQEARARLVDYVTTSAENSSARRQEPGAEPVAHPERLDPGALTIGFARRFASYKRATLLLRDSARLARIVNAAGRPVQFVFAGKAHPKDEGGKQLIEQLVNLSHDKAFRGRLVFLENYDTAMARQLVRGVDVWLNTPQRPHEASGTSGMKAVFNGVLNCSTLDGWWAEAWSERHIAGSPFGWTLGGAHEYADAERQAEVDAESLYTTLEDDIVPAFYERDAAGLPTRWVAMIKSSVATLAPYFNTDRMVREYTERYYFPPRAEDANGA